jgi:hypothetical protein
MKITHKQLRRIIKEELSRTLGEGRYTGGVKVGDSVWLKDNRDKGKGTVRGKYKDPQMGHIISVQWETGETSRHIPSALTTSQEMASTWQQRDDDPFTFKIDTYPPDIDEPADEEIEASMGWASPPGEPTMMPAGAFREEIEWGDWPGRPLSFEWDYVEQESAQDLRFDWRGGSMWYRAYSPPGEIEGNVPKHLVPHLKKMGIAIY